ncbi:hypothetical protein EHQ24_14525 [Leptospira noumeaensis]|uniref:Uncharacterized protein n=1 Tax=Leptospira noumeaensis TaxID=2484964 RepID=A0A4R9IAA3_9LEPT|nr:hypothetical protein [Leptospira noumeaensis]TGK82459.1 hypothetical protein EHQ24_14525 [Leptospira noumeaensis]
MYQKINRFIRLTLNKVILFITIIVFLNPKSTYSLNAKSDCEKFHLGTFVYTSSFGEVIIVRNKSYEINYRVYPNSYIRSSIKWISPCVAEGIALEINDEIFPDDYKKKLINKRSKLYITETFSDGYSYKLIEETGSKIIYDKVKFYKGTLPIK